MTRCHVFEADLSGLPGGPDAHGWSIDVRSGVENSVFVRRSVCRFERIRPEDVGARLAQGDSVAIAFAGGQPVGYNWFAYDDHWMEELALTLRVRSTEVVGYDGFVAPSHRGLGVLSALDSTHARAASASRSRQLVYVDYRNRSSLRSLGRMGKREFLRVTQVWLPLFRYRRTFAAFHGVDTPADALYHLPAFY